MKWQFMCHPDMQLWVSAVLVEDPRLLDDLEDRIAKLRVLRMDQWSMPAYKKLKGTGGLGEIRWKGVDKKQHRVFGFFGPVEGTYTMLAGGSHKGAVYSPKDILRTAERLMDDVKSNRVRLRHWEDPSK